MNKVEDIDTVRAEFIETVGIIAQADGLPRIAGRLLGLLIFDGGRHAFGDLAEKLQVSRGSVSSSARLLEHKGLIRLVSEPGERQNFFQLAEDPYANLLTGVAERARKAKKEIERTMKRLDPEHQASSRIAEYYNLFTTIEQCVCSALPEMKGRADVEND